MKARSGFVLFTVTAGLLAACGSDAAPPPAPMSFMLESSKGGASQGIRLESWALVSDFTDPVPSGDFYLLASARVALSSVDSVGRLCDKGPGFATVEDVPTGLSDCAWDTEVAFDDNVDFTQSPYVGDGFLVEATDNRGYRGLVTALSSQGGTVRASLDLQQFSIHISH
jgi:hypothetical protein